VAENVTEARKSVMLTVLALVLLIALCE